MITIKTAIAAADAVEPLSSMCITAIDASLILGEQRKITAETVVIEFTKRYMNISIIAVMDIGTVIREKLLKIGTDIESETFSNSLSSFFSAVFAVMNETE